MGDKYYIELEVALDGDYNPGQKQTSYSDYIPDGIENLRVYFRGNNGTTIELTDLLNAKTLERLEEDFYFNYWKAYKERNE